MCSIFKLSLYIIQHDNPNTMTMWNEMFKVLESQLLTTLASCKTPHDLCRLKDWGLIPNNLWHPYHLYPVYVLQCSLGFPTHHTLTFLLHFPFSSFFCYLMLLSPPLSLSLCASFSVFGSASVCLLVVPSRVKRLHYLDTLLMHAALWQTRAYTHAHEHKTPTTHSHNKNIHTLIKSNTLLHMGTRIRHRKEHVPQLVCECEWVQERKRLHTCMLFLYGWENTADSGQTLI